MRLEPRKRPYQQRSAATVDAILEAAARILERKGLDALTTNAVAELAGVSIGSLYQYFPGKAAILAELIRRERLILLAGIDRIAHAPGDSLKDDVCSLIRIAVAHQLLRPALARALEYGEATLPLGPETAKLTNELVRYMATLLERHGVSKVMEAAHDLVALAKGMIDAAGIAGESDQRVLVDRVCRAALGYLEYPVPIRHGIT
ncbi:Transcriptional regulator, TetR family [Acidithiobacillus ferrivorans]|uniref:Transcriptional regulator, TetR family n=1 Tax=Acidithiobacillus ferrivorans TaxID=160808 RepID=A0A060USC2_9PROT|nr:TetR/AcrR family transcriptional regulator [Acidithiobacillus ferrivorans]CDQ09698.1 Transcriptional regulator, TetR family [Acidithiobacillus ferrivorans]SMH67057.1 Transcriptional regulator, TetR family [Acidithiobacillus ferrivorans]